MDGWDDIFIFSPTPTCPGQIHLRKKILSKIFMHYVCS